ncbi:MAG: CehA/McbA family metallohydrolase [Cytophagales bacterium]|nr:CehA/McbA family metallohydrolase [Cytophagales bacterium]
MLPSISARPSGATSLPRWLVATLAIGCRLIALLPPSFLSAQPVPAGQLEVLITDSLTGQPTPARVRLTQRGRVVNALPAEAVAVMYGLWDHADGYGFQPDSAFYADGRFRLGLPPGEYTLSLSKGLEYLDQHRTVRVEAGTVQALTCRLARWTDLPGRGWYSADDHIHVRRSPREDPLLLRWLQAEDVHVGVLLRMGDFWETYYPQYAWGPKGVYREGNYLLTSGQEDPRTPELGHALGIGAADRVRYRDQYYYYDKVFDKLHELGGLTGYAHQGKTFHGYRGLTLDGLRGKVDVLELLQFCASADPLQTEHYYHLLDLGYRITAVAGSDFPWCGHDHEKGPPERTARIGNVRFYTYVGDSLSYEGWKAALAAGRTFVTSGPVLDLRVNDRLPGDSLPVRKGDVLRITARAYGHAARVPLSRLELVHHGRVIASVTPGRKEQTPEHLSLSLRVPAGRGGWIAARSYGAAGQAAHTTPVYVSVDGGGFHNPNTVPNYLGLSEMYLRELEHELSHRHNEPDHQAWKYREGLEARIAEVRKIIAALREKLR